MHPNFWRRAETHTFHGHPNNLQRGVVKAMRRGVKAIFRANQHFNKVQIFVMEKKSIEGCGFHFYIL